MRRSIVILKQLEAAAMTEMVPLYVRAITADSRGEKPDWDRFRELFERTFLLANIIGRMGIIDSLSRPTVNYAGNILTSSWDKAISIFLAKVPQVRAIVDRLRPIARARAFWVTGIEDTTALAKIQASIAERLEDKPHGGIAELHEKLAFEFSHARLENVVRTNTMTALNEGATEQVKELGDSVALLRLDEVHDSRTRGAPGTDNPGFHWQMDGFLERPNHPVWIDITPPGGFQCRGHTAVLSWGAAERAGFAKDGKIIQSALDRHNAGRWEIIRSGKYPDPGFKH